MNETKPQVRILLLEDDPNLGLIVEESLTREGFRVTLCRDGKEGLAALAADDFELCLVDVMMPRLDGFEFATRVRTRGDTVPLIFLTARGLTEDKVEGFRIGCDDYVTKPFSMEELLCRIEAVLRRGTPSLDPGPADRMALGNFIFCPATQTLETDGDSRQLTGREADLLEILCRHQGRAVERSFLLLRLWGDDSYHAGRSMDVFISRLRKYLQADPQVEIRTLHGQGFKLIVHGE